MNSLLLTIEVWIAGVAAAVNLIWGLLLKKNPKLFNLALVALVELAVLAQLVYTIAALAGGESPRANIFEFLGYLLVVLLVPAASVLWALAEKSRYSSIVLGIASFVALVMVYRMNQLWF